MKKVVTIGGGTGQYTLLKGLKNYDTELSAIVTVMDSGGSSGKLRTAFGILPPGDIRNCLLALTDDYRQKELVNVFSYRFPDLDNGLSNHNLGNLILTALNNKHGNMGEATKAASNILNINHNVLPVSLDSTNIVAKINSHEKILKGEEKISYDIKKDQRIKDIWLHPKAYIYKDTAEKIRNGDLIVICPGLLYGSVIPNFLVEGFKEAIQKSSAKIVYVCNLVTGPGTYGFKTSNFIKEIEKYLNKRIDYVICNSKKPTKKIVDKYSKEQSFFVQCDYSENNKKPKIIKENLMVELNIEGLTTARHNEEKTAKLILDIASNQQKS